MRKFLISLAAITVLASAVPANAALVAYDISGSVGGTFNGSAIPTTGYNLTFSADPATGGVSGGDFTLGVNGGFTTPLNFALKNASFNLSPTGLLEVLDDGAILLSFEINPVSSVTGNPSSFSVTGTGTAFDNTTVSKLAGGTFVGANESNVSFTAAVPEPSTWAMMILGFIGVGFVAYRRKRSSLRFV